MVTRVALWMICAANIFAFAFGSDCPTACKCDDNKVDCSNVDSKKFPDKLPENTTVLNLFNSGLKELDRGALAKFDNIQQLCMQSNGIKKINSEIFKQMTSLRRLDMSNNEISEVHKRAFTGLLELSGLILTGNQIDKINGALSRTHELTVLNLANNKLTEIGEEEFAKLTKLRFLDLGSNMITAIHSKAFQNLKDLRYLILQNNRITSLGVLSFSSNMLSVVDFTKNALARMPRGLPASVADLRAGNNKIKKIEKDDIANITRLQLLTLNGNSIAHIHDDAFKQARNLKEIWLTSNMLTALPNSLPSGLVKLFVNLNKIKKINADAFDGNGHLEYLTLEMNELEEISPKSLSPLKSLTFLNLQGNQLRKLSKDVYTDLDSLQVLTVANNPIASIESKALRNLNNLVRLDMSYNELNDVKLHMDIFKAMPKVQELNLMNSPGLSKSLLAQIQESNLSPAPSVQAIDLRYNNLLSLPTELPSAFPNLLTLKLGSNAWHCGSELLWMKKWLSSSKIKFQETEEEGPACCTPYVLKGQLITKVPDEYFLSPPPEVGGQVRIEEVKDTKEVDAVEGNDLKKTSLTAVGVEVNNSGKKENGRERRSKRKSRKKRRKSHSKRSKKDRKKRKASKRERKLRSKQT